MKKKQWQKPQLIVLVRSKPEEAVLAICKDNLPEFSGPDSANNWCGDVAECQECCDYAPS